MLLTQLRICKISYHLSICIAFEMGMILTFKILRCDYHDSLKTLLSHLRFTKNIQHFTYFEHQTKPNIFHIPKILSQEQQVQWWDQKGCYSCRSCSWWITQRWWCCQQVQKEWSEELRRRASRTLSQHWQLTVQSS